jgi:hypothetical protein
MKFTYISPSTLPSRTANSVHVVMQCAALSQVKGLELTLYAERSTFDKENLLFEIKDIYGVDLSNIKVVSYTGGGRGTSLKIAALALWDFVTKVRPNVILSRNLYASYVIGAILRRPILFETHQLETGLRKFIQRSIMLQHRVITVVISDALAKHLTLHHDIKPARTLVLHDAAPEGIEPLNMALRREALMQLYPQAKNDWKGVCGYFGHLYPGRGVEIIEAMAIARPDVLFLLFGGNEVDLLDKRANNNCKNLYFIGHVPHPIAQQVMRAVDVLLMPYQESVSIGISGHDTARWMSPMKMFEYMATGVPIISSNLPALCEILRNRKNALLVPPSDSKLWGDALDILLKDAKLASSIGLSAYRDYRDKHTWKQRALRLIEAAKEI